jgi:hypothetical protein
MALLKPPSERRRSGRILFTVPTCPYNGHQVGACRQLCEPVDGVGSCGRPAPQGLVGRTQRAIAGFKARQLELTEAVEPR